MLINDIAIFYEKQCVIHQVQMNQIDALPISSIIFRFCSTIHKLFHSIFFFPLTVHGIKIASAPKNLLTCFTFPKHGVISHKRSCIRFMSSITHLMTLKLSTKHSHTQSEWKLAISSTALV